MSLDSTDRLRVYTAPGEAADLQEMLEDDGVEFLEIGHIDELRTTACPGVLFLSRGLLGAGGALESLARLPAHVVVVAADDGGRSAATQADRLFLAAPELAPGEAPLLRALRSAGAYADLSAVTEIAIERCTCTSRDRSDRVAGMTREVARQMATRGDSAVTSGKGGDPDGGQRIDARIGTVCDIFDALTAGGGPSGIRVSEGRALEMLSRAAARGALDRDVVEVLAASSAWTSTSEPGRGES